MKAKEIQSAFQQNMTDGFKPTLAIIILANIENAEPVRSMFNTNGIAIFGVSTFQKFTEQGMQSDDIVTLLTDINPAYFKIVLKDYEQSSAYEGVHRVGMIGKNSFTNPVFIIS